MRFLALVMILFVSSCSTAYVREEPPRDIEEVIPLKPRGDVIWVQGHYAWRRGHWVWISGRWLRARPDRMWVSGHWKKTARGWVWIEGRWRRR